jgi:uncharacterized protein YgiM (DUF1202 family)
LVTITGCILFNQGVEGRQSNSTQTFPASNPDAKSTSSPTQPKASMPSPVVVYPTVQNTPLPTAAATPQTLEAVVAADSLNLRIGPGFDYAVVRLLQQGASVIPTGRSSDGLWIEVHMSDGSAGWVFGAYLQSSANLAALPVTEAYGGLDNPAPTAVSSYSILVSIDNNKATVTVARFPPNRKISAALGPAGKAPGLVVASGKTDASGRATLSFEMPATWENGSHVTEKDLVLAVSTNDSSFSRQVSVVYIH